MFGFIDLFEMEFKLSQDFSIASDFNHINF